MNANLRLRPSLVTALLCGFAVFSTSPQIHAQDASTIPHLLELFGVLPAPTYDPSQSEIPRRRPGHPYEPPPEFKILNPNGVPPAPVD